VCFITNIQDVTQRRQIEAERDRLREEQARIRSALETDRLKTELLNTVSHELRTPLAAIKGYATALLLFPDDVDQAERTAFLQEIEDAADRLSELVENLLQVGRGDVSVLDLRLERHDLGPLVAQAVVDARRRFPERTIELHDDGAAQPILADPHRIRQVLFNLIDNAIKFSPSTAAITISRSATADGRSHVIVQDRGIGIPPEHHERIFEPFYRVGEGPGHAAGGTGLGLAICRRIIEAHGGTIKVESVPGAGSAFIATLPAAARIEDTIAAP
jgi:two-component system sensor histidine kinase KdpD